MSKGFAPQPPPGPVFGMPDWRPIPAVKPTPAIDRRTLGPGVKWKDVSEPEGEGVVDPDGQTHREGYRGPW